MAGWPSPCAGAPSAFLEPTPVLKLEVSPLVAPRSEALYALEVCFACLGLATDPAGPVRVVYAPDAPDATNEPTVWIPHRPASWKEHDSALTAAGTATSLGYDLPALVFWCLTLRDERGAPRDAHGRATVSARHPEGWAPPDLASRLHELLMALRAACERHGVPLVRIAPWPDDRPFAVLLSHDVDRVFDRETFKLGAHAAQVARCLVTRRAGLQEEARDLWRAMFRPEPPEASFEALARLEANHDVRSTFFFLGGKRWARYGCRYRFRQRTVRAIAHRLKGQGHELGVHGSYYAFNQAMTYRSERLALEQAFAAPAKGTRNHYLRFAYPDTWQAQETAGYDYDATLGYHDLPGYRGGLCFPFHPFDPRTGGRMGLLALPLAVMDGTLFEYQGLDQEAAWTRTKAVLQAAEEHGGFAALLWHNNYFGVARYRHWEEVYRRAVERAVARGAWVAPAGEITDWWRARGQIRLRLERSGDGRWACTVQGAEGLQGLVLRVSDTKGERSLAASGHQPLEVG